jgi:hypothetical protein
MNRHVIGVLAVLALVVPRLAPAAHVDQAEVDLEQGIDQVRAGDLAAAVITLDDLANRLAAEPNRTPLLARTYVYLAIAYFGLSQVERARANVVQALDTHEPLDIGSKEFPPEVAAFLDRTVKGAEPESEGSRAEPEERSRGSRLLPYIVAGGAAGGLAAALAAGGGSSSEPADTRTPASPAGQSGDVTVVSTDVPRNLCGYSSSHSSSVDFGQDGTIADIWVGVTVEGSNPITSISLWNYDFDPPWFGTLAIRQRFDAGAGGPTLTFHSSTHPVLHEVVGRVARGRWTLLADGVWGCEGDAAPLTLTGWSLRLQLRQ